MPHSSNSRPPRALASALAPREPILIPDRVCSVAVRCLAGQLQVATLWRVIGRYAPRVKTFRSGTNPGATYDEFSVTIAWIPDSALVDMVNRLAALPWVLDAWFFP